MMHGHQGTSFEPEVIQLMKRALDDAVSRLPQASRTSAVQAFLAEKILKSAANGERDPINLCRFAMAETRESMDLLLDRGRATA
jgi:N-acetylglucosamine kinase-like BadF-type ATPase